MSDAPSNLRAPAWLKLSLEEEAAAFFMMAEALIEFKPGDFRALAWCVAVRAVRASQPKKRGRKPLWDDPVEPLVLVDKVEAELLSRGWKSEDPKAVVRVCVDIQRLAPALWGKTTPEQMRERYYKYRDLFHRLQPFLLSGNVADFPDPKRNANP
jgi:hypothetical protein